ncbi:MAG: thiamine biosynthesis lipoprotein [Halieaceae bacterium]|jgi:thiamine biosynthesis lipoprotein
MTSADRLQSHSKEWLFFVVGVVLLLTGCADDSRTPLQLSGYALGTTWHVTVGSSDQPEIDPAALRALVQGQLDRVNRSMSTYLTDSEISLFNASSVGVWREPSADFLTVLDAALAIGTATDGAYDITVGPLVDLWGFGPGEPRTGIPSRAAVAQAKEQVGQVKVERDGLRARRIKDVSLDFSSIAKGYAVDLVAETLVHVGVTQYMVEVGGEMRVAGMSPREDPWRIAIEQPNPERREVARAISITDVAVATSGDYRNYFDLDGERYSHTIDPRTGYPVRHDLVSVTVVNKSTMLADAWATALTVLGAEEAFALAEENSLAVYFIRSTPDGFVASHTVAFEPFMKTFASSTE